MNIDELFDKAKSAVNMAAKKTNEVVEVSRLKMDSVKLNNEINSMYEKLGRSVFNMKQDQFKNEDLIGSLCEEIDELLQKMSDLNDQIADKKNVVVCNICGAENSRESCYCCKCGGKLKDDFNDCHFDPRQDEQPAETAEPSAEEDKKDEQN